MQGRAEDGNFFLKAEDSIILLALKLIKISNMLPKLNTLIKSVEYEWRGKRPYRQMAEPK